MKAVILGCVVAVVYTVAIITSLSVQWVATLSFSKLSAELYILASYIS